MTTQELKSNIIQDIEELKDENILNILKIVLHTYKNEPIIISEKRMKILDEAKLQIKNNDYVLDEGPNKDDENWLKE